MNMSFDRGLRESFEAFQQTLVVIDYTFIPSTCLTGISKGPSESNGWSHFSWSPPPRG